MFGPTVHWGAHDATNLYGHLPNVVLAGTLFFPASHYEAQGRLASAHPSSRGRYDEERIKQVTLGEHQHMILQALCRGAVRKCDGCPPARAYIIASRRSGIVAGLPHIFPGAQVLAWRPVQKPLKGKVADAFGFIVGELARSPWSPVAFRRVMAHLGWTDARDFRRRVRQHPDFVEVLAAESIEEYRSGKVLRGFSRVRWRAQTSDRASLAARHGVRAPGRAILLDEVPGLPRPHNLFGPRLKRVSVPAPVFLDLVAVSTHWSRRAAAGAPPPATWTGTACRMAPCWTPDPPPAAGNFQAG